MPTRRHLLSAAAGLLAVPVVAACGAGGTDGTGAKGYVEGDGVITQVAAADRKPVGRIAGQTLDDQPVVLSTLAKGRPAVLNVWASWCAPCRKEAPVLVDAQRSLGDQAVFLGINVRDAGGTSRALAFERRFGITYPSLSDPTGRALLQVPGRLSSVSIPSTVVVDSQGRLAATVIGAVPTTRTLVDLVEDAG